MRFFNNKASAKYDLVLNGSVKMTIANDGNVNMAGRIKCNNARNQIAFTTPVNTTSTDWVLLPNMLMNVITEAGPLLVLFKTGGTQITGLTNQRAKFRLLVDNVEKSLTLHEFHNNGWELRDINLFWLGNVGAGTHTIQIQWCTTGGTLTTCWYNDTRSLIAIEL